MALEAEGGRRLSGRLSFDREAALRAEAALVATLLAAITIATRVPLRTRYLANWDADQFALGMAHFDVIHHQPHPPGYLGYILLGRLLLPLFGDANAALIALSVLGEALGVAALYLFARALFGRFAGLAGGLALLLAPLYWYYGEIANTYGLEPLLVLTFAWPAWRLWQGEERAAYPAALVLGLVGAIRPSTTVLLVPLFLLALRRTVSRRVGLTALALLAAAIGLWAVPLLVLSGGPVAFLTASLQLGDSVTAGTSVWNSPLNPFKVGLPAVLDGALWELGLFSVVLLFAFVIAPRLGRVVDPLPEGFGLFVAAWALPALGVFALVHIGQLAYVQVFTPALFLVVGPALKRTASALARPSAAVALLAVCLAGQPLIFFLPPRASLAGQLRQQDAHVAGMAADVSGFDPARTVLITDADAVGSYRTAQVYLPDYQRVALQRDRSGHLGEIYAVSYEPWRFTRETPPAWPAGADTFIVTDPDLLRYIPDRYRLRAMRLPDGTQLWVYRGNPPVLAGNQLWLDRRDYVRTAGARE